MQVKETTLGSYNNTPVPDATNTAAPAANAPDAPSTENIPDTPITPDAPAGDAAPVVAAPEEETVAFDLPFVDIPAADEQQPAAPQTDWREALKANRDEALKELGLDPFVVELNEHIKNGGSAEDYLHAKATDWNKVSDTDLLKQELKQKFPDATQAQIDRLFNKKYTQGEGYEAEENEDGALLMSAEARELRARRIEQQSKFQIRQAAPPPPAAPNPEIEAAQQQQIAFHNKIVNSEEVKALFQSKRVAITTGDGRTVNLEFTNPAQLLDVLFNPKVAQQIGRTPQGEPDVPFWLETMAFMANRDKYKKTLVGSPKALARQELVEEGRNAQQPAAIIPMQGQQYANYGEAFANGTIKTGTLGRHR